MPNQKSADVKQNVMVKSNEAKTECPSATAEASTKQNSNWNMLKMHSGTAIKLNQIVDYFKCKR